MMPPRPDSRPTRSVAVTAALLVLTAVALGAPAPAAAVCNVTSACSATAFLASAECCTATSCTIDVNVTVPGPACVWDFGSRNVTLGATTNLGLASLEVRTGGMVMVAGSAKILSTTGSMFINAGNAVTLDSGTLLQSTLAGDVDITGSAITAKGRIITEGGFVTMEALTGSITVDRPSGEGISAYEGGLALRTDVATPGADILVNTPVGVEGGDVEMEGAGKIEVQRIIQVGNYGDTGGDVSLTSTLNDVVISGQGKLLGSDPGDGGTATLDAARDVIVGNDILMRGESGGYGGEISVSAVRDVSFQGSANLDVSGTGGAEGLVGDGGSIDVAAGRNITLATNTRMFGNAGGSGTNGGIGGLIDLDAGSTLLGLGPVPGNLTINGRIVANGRSTAGNEISLGGCQVTIASGAQVDASGDVLGTTLVVARTGVTIAGLLKSTSGNVIELPTGATFTTTGGTITPAAAAGTCVGGTASSGTCRRPVCVGAGSPFGCLMPCPTCGDGDVTFPEACDEGPSNLHCVTGCTQSCQFDPCEDGNACTQNLCDPAGGCYLAGFVPNGTPCDDATVCDGREECRFGACQVITGSVPSCGDDNNPCTIESCDAVTGCQTTNAPNGATTACADPTECCTDLNLCDGTETCAAGACVAGTPMTCPIEGDVCTPATGMCASPTPCMDDGECDDGNPCTVDDCDAGGHCSNTTQTGPGVTGCDDGDACNGVEECVASECVPSAPPVCDDGDPCTSETCVAATGCTTPAPIANCCEAVEDCPDDGDACTTLSCVDRQCSAPTPVPFCCNSDAECDDGNTCTPGGTCQAHECVSVPPPDCTDDGDLCTDDFCDPVAGCVHAEIPGCCSANAECDDGTACTTDTCDPVLHTCSNVQEDGDCVACDESDVFSCDVMGVCANTTCVAGKCVPQTPPNCDDEDDCTDDSCKAADGCQHLLRSEDPQCTNVDCTDDTECADTDLCTTDTCEPKGNTCRHTAAEDVAAVTCRLDGIDGVLAGAGDDLITKPGRKKVQAKLKAVRKKLGKADGLIAKGKTKPAGKQYKGAANLLNALAKLVNKTSGKFYDPSVAVEIVDLATKAKTAVESVRSGLLAG